MTIVERTRAWVVNDRYRRLAYLIAAVAAAVLMVIPQPYVARAKVLPQESNSAGLGQVISSLGGQFSTLANLLTGGKPPNDLYLIIGRSDVVLEAVIKSLDLVGPGKRYATLNRAKIDLRKKVDVHSLLGGVVEVETRTHDPDLSVALTKAYESAISDQIASLTRISTRRKGKIVRQRFDDAKLKVTQTEHALDGFRQLNHLASPEIQLGAEISLRTSLQGQLAAKQVELETLRQTVGPESNRLLTVQTELAELRAQIDRTQRPALGSSGPNVAGLSAITSQYQDLFRDYRFAQALYDVYSRASEQTAVESLVAESASFIQVVEPANLDPERHYNIPAVAAFFIIILSALFTEVYAPITGLRWRADEPSEVVPGGVYR